MANLRSLPARLFEVLNDRLNPIVIKELRQAIQGRFVAALLLCFLLIQVLVLSMFLLFSGIETVDLLGGGNQGREVATIIIGFLFFMTIVVLPAVVAMRFHMERNNDGFALLYITTLKPNAIISGKLLANQALALLLFSACAPFLSFTYFLRGIDLLSILIVLAFGFIVMTLMLLSAIFLASLPVTRFLKSLIGVGAGMGLIMVFSTATAFSAEMLQRGFGSRLGSRGFWEDAGAFLVPSFLFGMFLFVLSSALVAPPASNRALPVRRYLSGAWLVSLALMVLIFLRSADEEIVEVWARLWIMLIGGAFLIAVSAPDQLSRRLRRELPRRRLARWVAFFFWPGSASGLAWALGLAAATCGSVLLLSQMDISLVDEFRRCLSMTAYFLAYALTTFILHRRFLKRWVPSSYTGVMALVLMILGTILPPIFGLFIAPDLGTDVWEQWIFLNPFAALNRGSLPLALAVSMAWAGLTLLMTVPTWVHQVRVFARPASADDNVGVLTNGGDDPPAKEA